MGIRVCERRVGIGVSVLIAFLFVSVMVLIPWENVLLEYTGSGFLDRSNYTNYFLYHQPVFEYREIESVLDYISFEIFWHKSIFWLVHGLGLSVDTVFIVISALILLVFALLALRWSGPVALFFLINPLVVDFTFSQLRLAFAISILAFAYLLRGRSNFLAVVLTILSPFFHTGSIIFIFIYFSIVWVPRLTGSFRQSSQIQFVILLTIGALVSIAIGPLREQILGLIGDRRADYHDMSSSFLYSAFWVSLLLPLGIWSRRLIVHDYYRYAVVILAIVAVNLTHGGYSTRFLAAVFPVLICSVLSLPRVVMVVVSLTFICYAIFQWLYRLGLA